MDLVIHLGKIREKLSSRGYYISQLGLIQEDKESDYAPGDIRYVSGIRKFRGDEEVIISLKGEGKDRLIKILQEESISFRKAKIRIRKIKKSRFNYSTQQLTNQD